MNNQNKKAGWAAYMREYLRKRRLDPVYLSSKREYDRKWRNKNRKIVREYNKEYQRKRRLDPQARKEDCEMTKQYYRRNKKEILVKSNIRRQARYKTDPLFRMTELVRARTRLALLGCIKYGRTFELIGCSAVALRDYIQGLFQPDMSWENYGDWHIDHIKPCAKFDLRDPAQQRACFHYTNLQPLWAEKNLRKGDKYGVV